LLGTTGQACCHDVGGRHIAVGVLMVFIDAYPFEAKLVGQFQLIEISIIEGMTELGIIRVSWGR